MTVEKPAPPPPLGFAMSHVTVTINGRQFRLACEDGEEGHLARLAADLDKRIEDLRARHGAIGDARLTIMAALTIADEVAETSAKVRKIEVELAALQDARVASAERINATQAAVSAAFNSAAERIENITRRLNQTVGDGGGVAMG
jgi:cell division protein ZapA